MKKLLFGPSDNAPLVLFRIFFGFLLACETFGAILTKWVQRNFIDPKFTFNHIGMDWLQPLPGYGMYIWFVIMGLLGIMIMLGYKYRFSIISFTILWAGVYFMQKTSYNNHYYLLMLIALMMCFLPANAYASLDAKNNSEIRNLSMPGWCRWVMVAQISIVYFYATVAKLYPGWLSGDFVYSMFSNAIPSGFFRTLFVNRSFAIFISYAGIAFDLLVVPLMLFKRTRTIMFVASLIFHLFNSVTLQIGIFPFFALSFAVFLYPPETIRRLFFKRKLAFIASENRNSNLTFYAFFVPFLIIQTLLPLRHHFIEGDVLWTEEGHRLSWRMMLRTRSGYTHFRVVNLQNGTPIPYNISSVLTSKQLSSMGTRPDMIWQMAQRIHEDFETKGLNVAVYADSKVAINNGPYLTLIDPETDLAEAKWDYFFHNSWIELHGDEHHKKSN